MQPAQPDPPVAAGAGPRLHSVCLGNAECPAQAAAHTSRRCRAAVRWHQGPSGALAAAQRNCRGAICGPRASPSPLPQCPGPARVTLQPSPMCTRLLLLRELWRPRLSEQPRATGAAGGPPLPAPVTFGLFPSRPHLIPQVRMGHRQHLPPAGWGGDDVARARCLEHSRVPQAGFILTANHSATPTRLQKQLFEPPLAYTQRTKSSLATPSAGTRHPRKERPRTPRRARPGAPRGPSLQLPALTFPVPGSLSEQDSLSVRHKATRGGRRSASMAEV